MLKKTILAAAVLLTAASAQAQGIVGGAAEGARQGGRDAGPVGAIVGGAAGAAVGGVKGLLGVDERPRFRAYVASQHPRPYHYSGHVVVGATLPDEGVTLYPVPQDYGVMSYRYAVIDDQTVLVDPATHRIVQIID